MVNDSEDDDITVHAATITKAGEEATKLLLNTSDDEDMTRASLLRSNGINIKGHNDDSD